MRLDIEVVADYPITQMHCGVHRGPYIAGGDLLVTQIDGATAYVCPDCARRRGGAHGRIAAAQAECKYRMLAEHELYERRVQARSQRLKVQTATGKPRPARSWRARWDEHNRRWIEY